MKTSLLNFGFALVLVSCATTKNLVGHAGKDNFIVDCKDEIKSRWNQLLLNNNLRETIAQLDILPENDTLNKRRYYYLLGKSANDSIKMAHRLIRRGGKFYFDQKDYPLTVICHGCTDAYPSLSFDTWGWSCESLNTECKKSVVVSR